ncbi:MAG: Mut7-C RNAse domain-containing protein [Thermodesulfobacteriota bacterium]|nr:Mut7-C RNAse domain-containing protein [Thermodesulfobacteriota bacterium]
MPKLKIIFSEEFNCFKRHKNKGPEIIYPLKRKTSIKNIIESLGVPHTEIGKIIAEDKEVDFNYIPVNSQKLTVLHIIPPFDVTRPSLLRPEPLQKIRFVVDVNVGKLALLLRMLGLDAVYSPKYVDRDILCFSREEKRIVLSKDTGLLECKQIIFGRHVQSVYPDDQLIEIIKFFGINGPFKFFTRCLRCNKKLVPISKKDILHRLEPKTKKYFNRFKICTQCRRIYWQGSHHEKMIIRLRKAGINI